jgi:hypothetical protein
VIETKNIYKLSLDDGKYEIHKSDDMKIFDCTRHGEGWRSLVGDNMVLALVDRIQELEERVKLPHGMCLVNQERLVDMINTYSDSGFFCPLPAERINGCPSVSKVKHDTYCLLCLKQWLSEQD